MNQPEERYRAVAQVAARWRDPDYERRERAVAETLEAPNRWTEEVLDYALNRWMQNVTVEALTAWLGPEATADGTTVGVLHGESEPLEGMRDLLAVVSTGHRYLGCVPDSSPALVPALAEDLREEIGENGIEFASRRSVLERCDALMAQPKWEEQEPLRDACREHGLTDDRVLLRPSRLAIGVLDGKEQDEECDAFAEDLLLYEGDGHRRLAILWAPDDLDPDPYLRAMARFRGVFPGHPDTPGALEMKKAFLEAQDEPHAYAAGLEFLVSRGEPEAQSAGHIRWSEYADVSAVETWIDAHRDRIAAVVARKGLHDAISTGKLLRTPGDLHVPALDNDEGQAISTFVRTVG